MRFHILLLASFLLFSCGERRAEPTSNIKMGFFIVQDPTAITLAQINAFKGLVVARSQNLSTEEYDRFLEEIDAENHGHLGDSSVRNKQKEVIDQLIARPQGKVLQVHASISPSNKTGFFNLQLSSKLWDDNSRKTGDSRIEKAALAGLDIPGFVAFDNGLVFAWAVTESNET